MLKTSSFIALGAILASSLVLAGDNEGCCPGECCPESGAPTCDTPVAAPDFKATDVTGKEFKLSDFHGKVVILDFWATWCPPCRAEIPAFVELSNEFKKDGLEVIGIALERNPDPKVLQKWLTENKVEYTVAIDAKNEITALYKDVPDTNGIQGIPTTLIIDRAGKVRKVLVGGHPKEAFETEVKPLLEEKAPVPEKTSGKKDAKKDRKKDGKKKE